LVFLAALVALKGEFEMSRIANLIGPVFLALCLLALGSSSLVMAAEGGGAQAPQAATSPAGPAQQMGPGMMGWGMAGRHAQMHGAPGKPGQPPYPCQQYPGAMGPGMMSGGMGPGMMSGGMEPGMMRDMDPKTRGQMMQLRGKYIKEMGELMEKRGKELEAGK
jgi:protein CpxP